MIYNPLQRGPFKVPGYHDPDSTRIMSVIFRPSTWTANTVYYLNDVVIPTTFTGQYHRAKASGKSAATESTWAVVVGGETTDGTKGLIWEAVSYNLMPPAETITAVTYENTNSVTVSSTSFTDTAIQFKIDALPAAAVTAGTFQVTAHVTKSNGELVDVTLEFRVAER